MQQQQQQQQQQQRFICSPIRPKSSTPRAAKM